ncbi:Potassium voltage-gated channel protein Shaker [Diplonema papillatum]|nr:Potassium voltage-gated channel protein Shaker [Diplonema papillatum]
MSVRPEFAENLPLALPAFSEDEVKAELARVKALLHREYGDRIKEMLDAEAQRKGQQLNCDDEDRCNAIKMQALHSETRVQLRQLQKESLDRLKDALNDSGRTAIEAEKHLNILLKLEQDGRPPEHDNTAAAKRREFLDQIREELDTGPRGDHGTCRTLAEQPTGSHAAGPTPTPEPQCDSATSNTKHDLDSADPAPEPISGDSGKEDDEQGIGAVLALAATGGRELLSKVSRKAGVDCPSGGPPSRRRPDGRSCNELQALRRVAPADLYSRNATAAEATTQAGQTGPDNDTGADTSTGPRSSSAASADPVISCGNRPWTKREQIASVLDPGAEQPTQGHRQASIAVTAFLFFLIVLSVTSFIVQSLPQFHDQTGIFFKIEVICVSVFTVEILLKVCTNDLAKLVRDPMLWIDVAAILPFYLDRASASSNVNLLFLRLAKVVRMFKVGQYSKPFKMVITVLRHSVDALILLMFLLFISVIVFSSLIWMAEQTTSEFDNIRRVWVTEAGVVSKFQSIPHAFWWCVCTLTTVGYGDDVPVSPLGKLVASVAMLTGIFVLAFPVILISYNYSKMLTDRRMTDDDLDEEAMPHNNMSRGSLLLPTGFIPMAKKESTANLAPVGTVIASWHALDRCISLRFNGKMGNCVSCTHDPLFEVAEIVLLPDCLHAVQVAIRLSDEACVAEACRQAEKVLRGKKMGAVLACPEGFVHCVRAESVRFAVDGLPEEYSVSPEEYFDPPDLLHVHIVAPGRDSLLALARTLPQYTISLSVTLRQLPLGGHFPDVNLQPHSPSRASAHFAAAEAASQVVPFNVSFDNDLQPSTPVHNTPRTRSVAGFVSPLSQRSSLKTSRSTLLALLPDASNTIQVTLPLRQPPCSRSQNDSYD